MRPDSQFCDPMNWDTSGMTTFSGRIFGMRVLLSPELWKVGGKLEKLDILNWL